MSKLVVLAFVAQILTASESQAVSWKKFALVGGFLSGSLQQATPAVVCPRFPEGSNLTHPENLWSSNGFLDVYLDFKNDTNSDGNGLFCYMTQKDKQSPTLRVQPGDHILFTLRNTLPADDSNTPNHSARPSNSSACGSTTVTPTSTNVHFHGIHASPTCHRDEVVKTVVNSGEIFTYDIHVPTTQPPGIYWYHPHIYGITEPAVQGGASGAIIVEGIENVQPAVAGLPEQILIIRDQLLPSQYQNEVGDPDYPQVPSWDLSLNYAPIRYPNYNVPSIPMKPSQKQFWRVVNAGADSILNLTLQYDGVTQPLEIVSHDGVPVSSAEATKQGSLMSQTSILLPPAGRAEFIVTGPSLGVKNAILSTLPIDTGPDGDNDPLRPVAQIVVDPQAKDPKVVIPAPAHPVGAQAIADLSTAQPRTTRLLYFSEELEDPTNPAGPTNFFITEDGQTPAVFDSGMGPAITTYQGTVEDWTIENRAQERHEFHIHQLHFLVLERNGVPVPPEQQQYQDTIDLPYWSGNAGDPYPSVKVRMDFTGPIVGKFIYHCHILGHEDGGMIAMIEVLPQNSAVSAYLAGGGSARSDNWKFGVGAAGGAVGIGVPVTLAYVLTKYWTPMKAWATSENRWWNSLLNHKIHTESQAPSFTSATTFVVPGDRSDPRALEEGRGRDREDDSSSSN